MENAISAVGDYWNVVCTLVRVVADEPAVIVGETKEALEVLAGAESRPVCGS